MKKEKKQPKLNLDSLKSTLYLIILLAFTYGLYTLHISIGVGKTISAFTVFFVLTALLLFLSNSRVVKNTSDFIQKEKSNVWLLPHILFFIFIIYMILISQLSLTLVIFGIILCYIPVLVFKLVSNNTFRLLYLNIFLIILFSIITLRILPEIGLPSVQSVVSVPLLILSILTGYIYVLLNNTINPGFSFKLREKDWQTIIIYFLALFVVIVFVGFATKYIQIPRSVPDFKTLILHFVILYFLVALPEELLFRGVFQNHLEKILPPGGKNQFIAIGISSIVYAVIIAFGTHNTSLLFNSGFTLKISWALLLITLISGSFYGYIFIKTRKITASAMTHALLLWTILNFFNG